MGISKPGRDTDYDDLTDSSSTEDKLNVVFAILRKSFSPIWLHYHKLKISSGDEKLFDAKLKATKFVDFQQSPTAYHPAFKLNDEGYLMLEEHGSYKQYLTYVKNQTQQGEEMDEIAIKNNILKQLNSKEVSIPYYFNELSIDTGYDYEIVYACCIEFNKSGYVSMSKQEVSMLPSGKLFIKTGGYKKTSSLAMNIGQIGNSYTTVGDQSPMVVNSSSDSLKEKQESPEDIALKTEQIENTRLSSELLKLQIRETKTKRKFAILGAIGGSALTFVSTHAKGILDFFKSLF